MSQFIEYVKMSTGQNDADIQDWKLTNCIDLVDEFVKKESEQTAKSFALFLESREFDGSPINKYWEEFQNQFNQ